MIEADDRIPADAVLTDLSDVASKNPDLIIEVRPVAWFVGMGGG